MNQRGLLSIGRIRISPSLSLSSPSSFRDLRGSRENLEAGERCLLVSGAGGREGGRPRRGIEERWFGGHLKIDRNLFTSGGSSVWGGYRGSRRSASRLRGARSRKDRFAVLRASSAIESQRLFLPLSSSLPRPFYSPSHSASPCLPLSPSVARVSSRLCVCARPLGDALYSGSRDEYALRVRGDEWLRVPCCHPTPPSSTLSRDSPCMSRREQSLLLARDPLERDAERLAKTRHKTLSLSRRRGLSMTHVIH